MKLVGTGNMYRVLETCIGTGNMYRVLGWALGWVMGWVLGWVLGWAPAGAWAEKGDG